MFANLLMKICGKSRTYSGRSICNTLALECLEHRLVLDAFLWNGNSPNTPAGQTPVWSDRENWYNETTQATAARAPNATDSVTFKKWFANSDLGLKDATVDAASAGFVGSLKVEDTYTKTITLDKHLQVLTTTDIAGGTVTGSKDLVIANTAGQAVLTWTGGTLSGENSFVIINPSELANISGSAVKNLSARALAIHQGAELNWLGGGTIVVNNEAGIRVEGTANFTVNLPSLIESNNVEPPCLRIFPSGTLSVTATGATVTVRRPVVNDGSVLVNQGSLNLSRNSRNSGTITVQENTQLSFGTAGFSTAHQFDSTQGSNVSKIEGNGTTIFNEKSHIVLTGTVDVGNNVYDSSNRMNGDGNLTIHGSYVWLGEEWSGTGKTTVLGGSSLTMPLGGANGYILGRRLVNAGLVEWSGGNINVTNANGEYSIENKAGATFDIQFDGKMKAGAGAGKLKNAGTLKRSGGNGTAVIELEPDPMTGGIQLKSQNKDLEFKKKMVKLDGPFDIEAGSKLIFADGFDQLGGTTGVAPTGSLVVHNTLKLSSGLVSAVGEFGATPTTIYAYGGYEQTGGIMMVMLTASLDITDHAVMTGGTLDLSNIGTVKTNCDFVVGGAVPLVGDGTFDLGNGYYTLVNEGAIEIDGPDPFHFSQITVLGDYRQDATAFLYLTVGPDIYHDLLQVTGTAHLAGSLYIRTPPGYAGVSVGQSFSLVSYGQRVGVFGLVDVNGVVIAGLGTLRGTYDDPLKPQSFTLWVDPVYP